MAQRFRIRKIVPRHELQPRILQRGTKNVAPDSSKAINANFNCHSSSLDYDCRLLTKYDGRLSASTTPNQKQIMVAGKRKRRKIAAAFVAGLFFSRHFNEPDR